MSNPIKLSPEELEELRKIQNTYQEKTFAFGQLYIEKLNLLEKEKEVISLEEKLKQDLVDAQKLEQGWMEKVSNKYGEGSLSLRDGTFTPNPK